MVSPMNGRKDLTIEQKLNLHCIASVIEGDPSFLNFLPLVVGMHFKVVDNE